MTDSPMYPHLLSSENVKNCGYNIRHDNFLWRHADGRECYASTRMQAERLFGEMDAQQAAACDVEQTCSTGCPKCIRDWRACHTPVQGKPGWYEMPPLAQQAALPVADETERKFREWQAGQTDDELAAFEAMSPLDWRDIMGDLAL